MAVTAFITGSIIEMYIEFASMVLIDFKAFRGRHALALNGTGVIYVVGDNVETPSLYGNGAAKSTIWDALTWCLYGKTPRGLKTTDVKPWAGGKPFVTVLLIADEQEFSITRTTSPKNLFTVNGKECADISDVLPISFELFVNTIVLPQERELFFDLKPSEKMELITEARGLERWDIRSNAASKAVAAFESEATMFLNEQRSVEGALEEVERVLSNTRKLSQSWNDDFMARKQVSKAAISALEKDLERKSNELDTATLTEDRSLTELRAAEREVEKLRETVGQIVADVRTSKAAMSFHNEQIQRYEEELADLSKAKICPTCDQPIKASNIAEHRVHLKAKVAEETHKVATELKLRNAAMVRGEKLQAQLESHAKAIAIFRKQADDAGDVITRPSPGGGNNQEPASIGAFHEGRGKPAPRPDHFS